MVLASFLSGRWGLYKLRLCGRPEKSMTTQGSGLGKVYVPRLALRVYEDRHRNLERVSVDASILYFVAEDLIAHSASGVALPKSEWTEPLLEKLPIALKAKFTLVDTTDCRQEAFSFLAPIAHEHGLEIFPSGGIGRKGVPPPEIGHAFVDLYSCLGTLIVGFRHQLYVDIDRDRLLGAATYLRSVSKSFESRANLAALEGILRLYQAHNLPGLVSAVHHRPELMEQFSNLLQDQRYQELSRSAARIGIPGRLQRTIELMRRSAQALLANETLKQVFKLGSKVVTAATRVPLPDTDFAESLLAKRYLPPLISLYQTNLRARRAWVEANPSPIPPTPGLALPAREEDWGLPGDVVRERVAPRSEYQRGGCGGRRLPP